MQKMDFTRNLKIIVENLLSREILEAFNSGFLNPAQNYDYSKITPLLFLSKSNYDRIKAEKQFEDILSILNAQSIYAELNLSQLTNVLHLAQAHQILTNNKAVNLFNFHNTLLNTSELSKNILQSKKLSDSLSYDINNGIIIFQVLIEDDGLETTKYVKIFSAISDLIKIVGKIVNEEFEKSEIILLDSGSDSNIGFKVGVETAKSLFLIFKEVWDLIVHFKYIKQKQKNIALIESLSIRSEIQKKIDEGILTEEEGKEYIHMIKTRTDDLIGMKVLPKQILIEKNTIENNKLLSDFEGAKMLTNG